MTEQYKILLDRIHRLYRRWRRLTVLKGGALALLTLVGVSVVAYGLDSAFELTQAVRLLILAAIVTLPLVVLVWLVVRPLIKAPTKTQLARYVEERFPELEDRLVSAVELGSTQQERFSPVLIEKLLEDTRFHVEPLNLSKTVQSKGALIWGSVALAVSVLLGSLIPPHLDSFLTKASRILEPWKITQLVSGPSLAVTPGNARVPKNSTQEIQAQVRGFEPEAVTIYFTVDDTTWQKSQLDPTEEKGRFVYNFFALDKKTRYYIKAGDLLSEVYTFTVYDAPKIKRVDLTYVFPEYTGLKPKVEKNAGDVWAPIGTVVKITAVADKKLRLGQVLLGERTRLRTVVSDTLIRASFTVTSDTYYRIRATDIDGLSNDPAPEFYVHAIPDEPPSLSVEKPGRDIKASMVEEVPIRVQVQDDFGVAAVKLFYTVNDGEQKTVVLKPRHRGASRKTPTLDELQELTAEHMFYLEDLGVHPGDFITYYVQARDNRDGESAAVATSEIFFIEVRPFEMEFYRPLSQSGPGAGQQFGGRLSGTQKEIIVATWKLRAKEDQVESEELRESLRVIRESQENLKEVTESVMQQMNQRSIFTGRSGTDITTHYYEAIKAMDRVLKELDARQLAGALVPERTAYQHLLRAEAAIKEVQIQRAQAQGLGAEASLDELAQLFEDEMDKLKSKYETLQESQQTRRNQGVNEALEKVKELARRQQQFNQMLRDLARKQMNPEEKKRKIEELRRQQEQLQRETQRLNRQVQELRRQGARIPRSLQNKLRQASSEMNKASNDLQRENMERAVAQGQRALNRLRQLEDNLHRNLNESLRKQFDTLEQEFQRLAQSQKELTKELQKLQKNPRARPEKMEELQDSQRQLKEDMAGIQNDLNTLWRDALKTKKAVARDLTQLSRTMEKAKLPEKMEGARRLLAENRLNSALQAEKDIQNQMEKLGQKMTQLREKFAETDAEKLDLALNQTQRLREDLEALKEETQKETPQGRQAKAGRAQSERTSVSEKFRAGPAESGPPPKLTREQAQRWREQLYRTLQELGDIRQMVKVDTSLSREFERIAQQLNGIVRNFGGGDPNKLALIENKVLMPLKNLEAELAQKLEILNSKEKLFLAREEKIPPEYETLVQKYYEALSETKKK